MYLSGVGWGTPTNYKFIQGCSVRGLDPLPFHILNFGKSGLFIILSFNNWRPFHLPKFLKKVLPPFTYFSLKRCPFYIPPAWNKGSLSHTWSPKKVPLMGEASQSIIGTYILTTGTKPETHNLLETCSHHTILWFHATEYSLFPWKYFSRINHPFLCSK